MGTKRIKYLGPYSSTSINDDGPTVNRGETIEVPDYYADACVKNTPDEWAYADAEPAKKKGAAETP